MHAHDGTVTQLLEGLDDRPNSPELRRGGQHLGSPPHTAADTKLHANQAPRQLQLHRRRRAAAANPEPPPRHGLDDHSHPELLPHSEPTHQ